MSNKLKEHGLFDFVESIIIPAFWCCVAYSVILFSWSLIYFCCNTIPSLNQNRKNKLSSCGSVFDGSKCCNKFTYLLDLLNSCGDITLALFILFNIPSYANQSLWKMFGYISGIVSIIGIILLIIKFKILSKMYPYITKWRESTDKLSIECYQHYKSNKNANKSLSKWKTISNKHSQISLFLKHQIMYDLFSASLQDAIQAALIFYIFAEMDRYNNNNSIGDKLLLNKEYNEWDIFDWILRIKLFMCLIFMTYKLFRVIGIECNCHSDKIRHESNIKPKNIDIDSDEYDERAETNVIENRSGRIKNKKQIEYELLNEHINYNNDNIRNNANNQLALQIEVVSQSMQSGTIERDIEEKEEKMDPIKFEQRIVRNDNVLYVPQNDSNYIKNDNNITEIELTNAEQMYEKKIVRNGNVNNMNDNGYNNMEMDKELNVKKDKKVKKIKKSERLLQETLLTEVNDYGDVDNVKLCLGDLGGQYEEEWRKNIIKLIEENKEELQNKTMEIVKNGVGDQEKENSVEEEP